LKQVRQELGTTVFLTTHYLDEAEGADKVVIINKGKIIVEGTPKQIKEDLVEKYLRVESKGNEKTLEQELQKLNLDFSKDGQGFRIHLKNGSEEIHRILKSISSELNDIDIHLPTLEEAYLEIIQGKLSHD
jgi:ABC-type multidrug transport system ATPase subunit